jgi:putative transposase
MARLPRIIVPGQPQHVIQRGNNRAATFFTSDDYRYYLDCLAAACERYGGDLHAYVLMTNHVHLLITPQRADSLARILQHLGRRYVRYFNRTHGRTGTLWEGRYKATLIDSARYLLVCYRYIELNPVRAGIVSRPEDYPWSSYRAHSGAEPDPLLQDHFIYHALGSTPDERHTAYRALFSTQLDVSTLDAIRRATQSGEVLGGDRFKVSTEAMLKRRVVRMLRGGDRRSAEFLAAKKAHKA